MVPTLSWALLAGSLLFGSACREPEQAEPAAAPAATAVPPPQRPDWDRGSGVRRLGERSGRRRALNGARPILAGQAEAAPSISLEALPAGRLYLSVLRTGSKTAGAAAAECRATLRQEGAPAEVIARLSATAGVWADAEAAVPALVQGTLSLECAGKESGDSFLWSQPFLAPLESRAPAPLVVLVSLDTLRADHVSGFGAQGDPTPALGRLAQRGVRFGAAASQGTFTLSSHFALLFSRVYGFPPSNRKPPVALAHSLAEAGFASIGVTNGGLVGSKFRFDSGFDRYAEPGKSSGSDDIELLPEILSESLEWIDRLNAVPTFLFVHSYAAHDKPPAEVASRAAWKRGGRLPPPDVVEAARSFYLERVREMDRGLAPFFARLEGVGQERPVLLIVTSDHGEAFGEHGNFRHGYGSATLYQEVIHVPLVVFSPGFAPAGELVRSPAMLLDLGPSILDWLGVPIPESMVGTSLLPAWSGVPGNEESRVSISHTAGQWSLRAGDRKLIVVMGKAGESELFDLATDPGERRDLSVADPKSAGLMWLELASRLRELEVLDGEVAGPLPRCRYCGWQQITEFWSRVGEPEPLGEGSELDRATLDQLRALGYADESDPSERAQGVQAPFPQRPKSRPPIK